MIHERPKSFGAGLACLMGLGGMGAGGGLQTGTHARGSRVVTPSCWDRLPLPCHSDGAEGTRGQGWPRGGRWPGGGALTTPGGWKSAFTETLVGEQGAEGRSRAVKCKEASEVRGESPTSACPPSGCCRQGTRTPRFCGQ